MVRRITQWFDGVRGAYDNLTDRERHLVLVMAGVAAMLLIGTPVFLTWQSVAELESENEDLRQLLAEFRTSGPALQERIAARKAAENLYKVTPPPLGTFLEAKAKESGYDRPVQMTEEPDKVTPPFRRTHTRASFSGVGLTPFLTMLAEIKNSPYPIAVERVQVEHYQKGDKYNVEVGVFAFAKDKAGKAQGSAEEDEGATLEEDEEAP